MFSQENMYWNSISVNTKVTTVHVPSTSVYCSCCSLLIKKQTVLFSVGSLETTTIYHLRGHKTINLHSSQVLERTYTHLHTITKWRKTSWQQTDSEIAQISQRLFWALMDRRYLEMMSSRGSYKILTFLPWRENGLEWEINRILATARGHCRMSTSLCLFSAL